MSRTRNTVKKWFLNFLRPSKEQFHYWMESTWFKDEKIPTNNIEGLSSLLNAKADSEMVSQQLSQKVDKVDDKGLSANDYTTIEKNKLAGIEEGANNYVLPALLSNITQTDIDKWNITGGESSILKKIKTKIANPSFSAVTFDSTTVYAVSQELLPAKLNVFYRVRDLTIRSNITTAYADNLFAMLTASELNNILTSGYRWNFPTWLLKKEVGDNLLFNSTVSQGETHSSTVNNLVNKPLTLVLGMNTQPVAGVGSFTFFITYEEIDLNEPTPPTLVPPTIM